MLVILAALIKAGIVYYVLNEMYNKTTPKIDSTNISTIDSEKTVKVTRKQLDDMIANREDISEVDVSNITDMSYLFNNYHHFNQDISNWDVSNVTDMSYMFYKAWKFNQDIGKWDVSNVTDMTYMFSNAGLFNQYIGKWDVSNVTEMNFMFYHANDFNQDISKWDLSNDIDMGCMFDGVKHFIFDTNCEDNKSNIYHFKGKDIYFVYYYVGTLKKIRELIASNCENAEHKYSKLFFDEEWLKISSKLKYKVRIENVSVFYETAVSWAKLHGQKILIEPLLPQKVFVASNSEGDDVHCMFAYETNSGLLFVAFPVSNKNIPKDKRVGSFNVIIKHINNWAKEKGYIVLFTTTPSKLPLVSKVLLEEGFSLGDEGTDHYIKLVD